MDRREIADHLAFIGRISAQYGNSPVAARSVYSGFEQVALLEQRGFAAVRPGLYAKVVDSNITHVIKLQALKGGAYTVWWGLSLAYVPHDWHERLRWHKTLHAARLDLFETPGDFWPNVWTDWRQAELHEASTLHGETYLNKTLSSMWRKVDGAIMDWFAQTRSLPEVLHRAEGQIARTWLGPLHHPDPLLVGAFTLGRLGRPEAALAVLDRYIALGREGPSAQQNLRKALLKISAHPSVGA